MSRRGLWAAKSRKGYTLDENGEKIRLRSGTFKSRKVNTVDWNDKAKAGEWRAAWANAVNAESRRRNIDIRVDHRGYERRGIERIPTVHMGVAATRMGRRYTLAIPSKLRNRLRGDFLCPPEIRP
ncbi:MAG: MobA/MobL family protein [Deltaproteobacteria bacterium]|nr:MobA/MobL family protein [Deltaproteobacteria bacterium]